MNESLRMSCQCSIWLARESRILILKVCFLIIPSKSFRRCFFMNSIIHWHRFTCFLLNKPGYPKTNNTPFVPKQVTVLFIEGIFLRYVQILRYDRKSIKQNLLSLENIYLRNPKYIICGYITDVEITALFYVYYKNQETFHLEVYK